MLQEVGMPNQHNYLWKTEVNNVSLKGKKEGGIPEREKEENCSLFGLKRETIVQMWHTHFGLKGFEGAILLEGKQTGTRLVKGGRQLSW